jgi:transcriptional regulator with GAF, ATPase, and Fis domain
MTRLNLLPDPRFEALSPDLQFRIDAAADAVDSDTFPDLFDALMRSVLQLGFNGAGAHEGTVWLADRARAHLIGVYNTGPAAHVVRTFRQPLSAGLISMVFQSEQPFCENDVDRQLRQDKTLDRKLGKVTYAMIAVPFYFARSIRGVISCVQLRSAAADVATELPGFELEHLRSVQLAAAVLTRLIDYSLIGSSTGWAHT